MDFNLSEEHTIFMKTIQKFMEKEIAPLTDQIDREDQFPEGLWKQLGELGILGITVPEAYGGTNSDILAATLMMEKMGQVSPAVALSVGAHAILSVDTLYRNANEEQRNKYLPGLCSGEKVGAMALTEPNSGSDAVSIQTTAVKKGDYYVLNGSKTFITNGPIADVFVVYAKTDRAAGAKGVSAFIVERGTPGFTATKHIEKMGNKGSPTGELSFDDCMVPAENLLGEENKGIAVMMGGLDRERAFFSGMAVGTAQGAFNLALNYSKERFQFGKPIASFQLIQAKLADMYTSIEAARYLSYRAAVLADASHRGGAGTEIHKIAASALLFSAETATKVTNDALQIHGGYGYTLEYPINRFYRDAKLGEIGAGTSEIRRLIIARELIQN